MKGRVHCLAVLPSNALIIVSCGIQAQSGMCLNSFVLEVLIDDKQSSLDTSDVISLYGAWRSKEVVGNY